MISVTAVFYLLAGGGCVFFLVFALGLDMPSRPRGSG
jgi:hypothetical protein